MTIKVLLLLLSFTVIQVTSIAQIKGVVKDESELPLSFASIKLKHTTYACITDSLGKFFIEGSIGDTIQIYHLNIGCKEVVVRSNDQVFRMNRINHELPEIEVASGYAFRLFDICKKNTYDKLRQSYLSRSYWRGIDICGSDTLCLVDIDFDIEQKKLNKLGKEAVIKCRKVQERIVIDSTYDHKKYQLNFQVRVKPFENNFLIYKDFEDEYVCFIKEDGAFLKLFFFPKRSIKKGYNNIEVSIWKDRLCIDYIASCTAKSKQQYGTENMLAGRIIKNREDTVYAKYQMENDIYYLSDYEMIKTFDFITKDGTKLNRRHVSRYHVYNNGEIAIQPRTGKMIYEFNVLERAINNYQSVFWKQSSQIGIELYDFKSLRVANEL